jgi:hypothetical protein
MRSSTKSLRQSLSTTSIFVDQTSPRIDQEAPGMIVTWEEALAEREARGETRGQLEAAREADLRAARRRFGSFPAEFGDRLEAIDDLDRLSEILDQILEAESLDDIDLPAPAPAS